MLRYLLFRTPKAFNNIAQGKPSDAVARRHPGLVGNHTGGRGRGFPIDRRVAPRNRPCVDAASACRRLMVAWFLGRHILLFTTQGGVILA